MGFFKDIRDVSRQGKELGDYHGGMPTWKQAMSDFRAVADDRGQGEVLRDGTPAGALVKGPPMPVEGDRFAMQILLEVQPPGGGAPYEVNYVFPAARMKAGLMPGQTVPIKIHPDDPRRIAVHWGAQQANIAAAGGDLAAAQQGMQNLYASTPDAAMRRAMEQRGEPAGATGGDVPERLAKLADLRRQAARAALTMADELELRVLVDQPFERAANGWLADPPPAIAAAGLRLCDQTLETLVYEGRHQDASMRLMNFLNWLGPKVDAVWRLTVRFDRAEGGRTQITALGRVDERTRTALGRWAAEHGRVVFAAGAG